LGDGSYRLGVARKSSQFNYLHVWGIYYFWPEYLLIVRFGLWKNLVKSESMSYQSCSIR
jgi:hypothetical protein